MMKVVSPSLPNIPWQERSKGDTSVLWRYTENPILKPDIAENVNSIFNSAVVPFGKGYAGIFRCDDLERNMDIRVGFSEDGIHWDIHSEPIKMISDNEEIARKEYRYDPRVCCIDGRYYITWCNGYHGPTIGVGYTDDFKTFFQIENAFLPFNRNGVLFPRKIGGNFAMLSRPSDNGHTPFGDIYYSESPDMNFWGKHRFVMGSNYGWQGTKIGAGAIPIETEEGWLLLYHGVLTSCNGFLYSFGAAILDKDQPWKVLYRTRPYLMTPREDYERIGDVPNVVFPCAALCDGDTNRLAVYYGCADTVTGLAFGYVDEIIDFVKTHSF